ncbi:MAG: TetR family transcriptional regulator [Proteobacteria bacterium]|nr:TetR family transcriptional regulator [Pseudomonadota bacterium]
MKLPIHMTISELSKETSITIPTIRSYIGKGLLPKPLRTSKTMAYYTAEHMERLKFIKKMREEKRLPLSEIKTQIETRFEPVETADASQPLYSNRRGHIVETAFQVFKEKGYSETTINDIVLKARVGKGTFYQYYQNKEDLFLECADRIVSDLRDEMENLAAPEEQISERLSKRMIIFLSYYPRWIDFMNILRGVSVSQNETLRKKLNQVMKIMTEPIIQIILEEQKNNPKSPFNIFDANILGYSMMGIAEYGAYLFHTEPEKYNQTEILNMIRLALELFASAVSNDHR